MDLGTAVRAGRLVPAHQPDCLPRCPSDAGVALDSIGREILEAGRSVPAPMEAYTSTGFLADSVAGDGY